MGKLELEKTKSQGILVFILLKWWDVVMNEPEDNGYDDRKRSAALHFWHASMIAFLAISGLILYSEYWKALLGETRL